MLEDEDGVEAATEGIDDPNDDDGFGEKKKKKKSKDKDKDVDPEEDFGKKKKKKKKDVDDEDGEDDDGGEATNSGSNSADGIALDYYYDELLGEVFGILREKNLSLSEKTKTIIKPLQVLREGTKTVFANLIEICTAMNRSPEHVIQYMMPSSERLARWTASNG